MDSRSIIKFVVRRHSLMIGSWLWHPNLDIWWWFHLTPLNKRIHLLWEDVGYPQDRNMSSIVYSEINISWYVDILFPPNDTVLFKFSQLHFTGYHHSPGIVILLQFENVSLDNTVQYDIYLEYLPINPSSQHRRILHNHHRNIGDTTVNIMLIRRPRLRNRTPGDFSVNFISRPPSKSFHVSQLRKNR